MTGRQVFSESEKVCVQELVVKYKLNSTATMGAGNFNPAVKKNAWIELTNEFNSIENNSKRTTIQLKKCWDNLKTRRKQILAAEKRQRMRTGGGPYTSEPSTSTATTQDSMLIDEDVLAESTDVELTFAIDSDATIPLSGTEDTLHSYHEQPTVRASEVPLKETVTVIATHDPEPARTQQHTVSSEERPMPGQRRSAGRRNSQLSDQEGVSTLTAGPTNYRRQVVLDEFSLREEKYKRTQAREEELHQIKLQESNWLMKAAEEFYKKNNLEKEAAQLKVKAAAAIYKRNELEREAAEFKLNLLKNGSLYTCFSLLDLIVYALS